MKKVVRVVVALAIATVLICAAGAITLNNSPTVQQWVADNWIPREQTP
jgi:hypothetical protein